jgi:hypothetical protein
MPTICRICTRFSWGVLWLSLLAGCAHYRLGPPSAPAFHAIHVAPADNAAFAPQAAPLVTAAVRQAFARDGRISLAASPADADVVLHTKLVSYDRTVAASRRDDTGLARKFAVTLSAEITLVDRSGQTLVDRRFVRATRDVFLDSGLPQAEYQTMPLFADALAVEIAHAVLDVW